MAEPRISETDRRLFAALRIEPCDLDDIEIEMGTDDLAAKLATSERFVRDVLPEDQADEYFHPETLEDALDLIDTYRRSDNALRATIRQLIAGADPLHASCERWIMTAQRQKSLICCQCWMIAVLGVAAAVLAGMVIAR